MKQMILAVFALCSIWTFAAGAVEIGSPVQGRPGIVYATSDGSLIRPAPGYTWTDDSKTKVQWTPGIVHTNHPHVVSSTKENNWNPAPGYRWANDIPGNFEVIAKAVFSCGQCRGSGRVRVSRRVSCPSCGGRKQICSSCNGRGKRVVGGVQTGLFAMPNDEEVCVWCLGQGYRICSACAGLCYTTEEGISTCPRCNGTGTCSE